MLNADFQRLVFNGSWNQCCCEALDQQVESSVMSDHTSMRFLCLVSGHVNVTVPVTVTHFVSEYLLNTRIFRPCNLQWHVSC